MVEIMIHEYEESLEDPLKQLMTIRGLIMLLFNPEVERDRGQLAGCRIIVTMNKILGKAVA